MGKVSLEKLFIDELSDINATGFTQGSVLFIGSSNNITEDNTNFFWDDTANQLQLDSGGILLKDNTEIGFGNDSDVLIDYDSSTIGLYIDLTGQANTNLTIESSGDPDASSPVFFIDGATGYVGIKTNTPENALNITNGGVYIGSTDTSLGLNNYQFAAVNETGRSIFGMYSYGNGISGNSFEIGRARGTLDSPSDVTNGRSIFKYDLYTYFSNGYVNVGRYEALTITPNTNVGVQWFWYGGHYNDPSGTVREMMNLHPNYAEFNGGLNNIDFIVNGNTTASLFKIDAGAEQIQILDDKPIALGNGQDILIDYDSGNNSFDIDLTGGINTGLRFLLDGETHTIDGATGDILIGNNSKLQFNDTNSYINHNGTNLVISDDTQVSMDSDLVFTGGGFPYGYMTNDVGDTITIGTSNTWIEASDTYTTWTSRASNLTTFGGSHYIAVDKAGTYKIEIAAALEGTTAGDKIGAGVMVNGTIANSGAGHAHSTIGNNNDQVGVSTTYILTLNANDQISLGIINHTAARDLNIIHSSVVVTMIGN